MNLKSKFDQLLQLLIGYVAGHVSCNELQLFVWEIIDYFTDTPPEELPENEKFERPFWYAIWQIQHLCDDEHEEDGVAKRKLEEALAYMEGRMKMPDVCVGRRPH